MHYAVPDTPLLATPAEEEGCYACHSPAGDPGNPGAPDVQSAFALPYRHPVELTSGVHAPGEDPTTMARHVECADCHNPHAALDGTAMDAMREVPGIDASGLPVDPALEPQQVCYRCHGIDPEPVEDIPRLHSGFSIREQLGVSAASAHPVERDAQGLSPSLRPEWQSVVRIGCEDCHGAAIEWNGARGPHGSTHPFLLERKYKSDPAPGFQPPDDAAICDKCHDVSWIVGSNHPFKHKEHKHFWCGACHSPHGVAGGAPENTVHLVNFDLRLVEPYNGVLEYVSTGPGSGNCTLRCHGKKHDRKHY
jgi:hypothetical protein